MAVLTLDHGPKHVFRLRNSTRLSGQLQATNKLNEKTLNTTDDTLVENLCIKLERIIQTIKRYLQYCLDCEMEVNIRKKSEIRQPIYTNFKRRFFSTQTFWSLSIIPIQQFLACFIFLSTSLCATATVGESISVVLATKPVLFFHDVDLICTIQTVETPGHMAWIKIPNGETLALNNKTSNTSKYDVDMKYDSSKMNYTLTIKKFSQSDVNSHYRCDSGFLSQYENLLLNKEDYIAMPEENKIERNVSLSDRNLRGTIQVDSVYPELYNCAAVFGGEDITSQLKIANSSTTKNSIFYNMVIEISHSTEKCKGMINVTCSVGIKRIQLMANDLDECLNHKQDTGISGWILATVLISVFILILVPVCTIYCLRSRLPHYTLIYYHKGKQNTSPPCAEIGETTTVNEK